MFCVYVPPPTIFVFWYHTVILIACRVAVNLKSADLDRVLTVNDRLSNLNFHEVRGSPALSHMVAVVYFFPTAAPGLPGQYMARLWSDQSIKLQYAFVAV